MTERFFRTISGAILLTLLLLSNPGNNYYLYIYLFISVLFIEGITNWRIPRLISRLRDKNKARIRTIESSDYKYNFEAERALRLLIVFFLTLTFVIPNELGFFPDYIKLVLSYVPFFIGFILFTAGLTNYCVMKVLLRWVGFK